MIIQGQKQKQDIGLVVNGKNNMKIEDIKQIIREELQKELNEAYMDQDIPAVATILKSIAVSKVKPRGPLRRVSVYVRDGILYLGEQIKNAEAIDIESSEFKQLLNEKNINAVGAVLNSYLGMEDVFVGDFVNSLKQINKQTVPKNTDDVSTIAPDLDATKK